MDWRQSLAGVDEDYLVGISNKGIVKRAYKDMEAEGDGVRAAAAGLDWNAPELTVQAAGETVTIRFPLGESRCSCPSRSICRHVVMAILLARQAAGDGGSGEAETEGSGREIGISEEDVATGRVPGAPENQGPAGEADQGKTDCGKADQGKASQGKAVHSEAGQRKASQGKGADSEADQGKASQGKGADSKADQGKGAHSEAGQGKASQGKAVHSEAGQREKAHGKADHREGDREPDSTGAAPAGEDSGRSTGSLGQQVWQEILARPRKPLFRALGNKGLRRLAAAMEAGNLPRVERGTVGQYGGACGASGAGYGG